ncbi:hypothetical protein LB545_07590 [Mesorhizobium sp. BR1-1-6]|uniref:hypothetical protein n=1 Tax=Mesorhizobium sp. BR1-1-6 TaxID=2876648 RepID=UPI001CD0E048|nr:hypothetical protein [Mesorhizobium sp. BR1-1-6]MBZ9894205.1 hypothetical protein [Mesorhizobium sp. BR1-1-6]
MNATFAKSCGYHGSSPALLAAFERIQADGIAEARAKHFERKRLVDQFKAEPGMFFATIRPALCTEEAIEDANRFIFRFRNLPTYRQQNRTGELRQAKQTRVICRYFRRYGKAVWLNKEAA